MTHAIDDGGAEADADRPLQAVIEERDKLRAQVETWRTAIATKAESTETGTVPDPCPECDGTGRGHVALALANARKDAERKLAEAEPLHAKDLVEGGPPIDGNDDVAVRRYYAKIIYDEPARIAAAVKAEREACIAILRSAAPSTRAEQAIEKIAARMSEVPPAIAGLIAEWLEASADELHDLQEQIRARGDV